jgi:hypothetical protein
MAELRDAIGRCPGTAGTGNGRWTIVNSVPLGEDSLLIRITTDVEGLGGQRVRRSEYAAVARMDDVIVVVADVGWENASGYEPMVRHLTLAALGRAEVLR